MTNYQKQLVPFNSKVRKVKKAWIDYNGHMNVAYYTLAFDKVLDDFLEKMHNEKIGCGVHYRAIPDHSFYSILCLSFLYQS